MVAFYNFAQTHVLQVLNYYEENCQFADDKVNKAYNTAERMLKLENTSGIYKICKGNDHAINSQMPRMITPSLRP